MTLEQMRHILAEIDSERMVVVSYNGTYIMANAFAEDKGMLRVEKLTGGAIWIVPEAITAISGTEEEHR